MTPETAEIVRKELILRGFSDAKRTLSSGGLNIIYMRSNATEGLGEPGVVVWCREYTGFIVQICDKDSDFECITLAETEEPCVLYGIIAAAMDFLQRVSQIREAEPEKEK